MHYVNCSDGEQALLKKHCLVSITSFYKLMMLKQLYTKILPKLKSHVTKIFNRILTIISAFNNVLIPPIKFNPFNETDDADFNSFC